MELIFYGLMRIYNPFRPLTLPDGELTFRNTYPPITTMHTAVFSNEFKQLIAESREEAVSLGYNYISTLHFILADCKRGEQWSLRNFLFHSDTEYRQFEEKVRAGEPAIANDSVRLTREAEKSIRKAFKLWSHSNYIDAEVRPYHLFLGAALVKTSFLYQIAEPKKDLVERLEQFYIERGLLASDKISKPLWMRLSIKLFS